MVQVKRIDMRQKIRKENMKGKQKQEEPEASNLEIPEYVFDGKTPNKHASK